MSPNDIKKLPIDIQRYIIGNNLQKEEKDTIMSIWKNYNYCKSKGWI